MKLLTNRARVLLAIGANVHRQWPTSALAEAADMSPANLSPTLRALCTAGLIEQTARHTTGPQATPATYRITAAGLKALSRLRQDVTRGRA